MKTKKNRIKDKNYLLIILLCLLLLLLAVPLKAKFGSNVDWITQHVSFPEYFRKLFYETKSLFPNLALSIGAGQNIYNFSYYGLFNPIILISYLLPFVDMSTYLIVVNIILYVLTGLASYYFYKTKTKKEIALVGSILTVLSSPLLFHLHRHFMFVNYFPFLFLALIGTDKYINEKKLSLVAFSTFMIIMISYYYSVASILVICIYALYSYIEKNPNFKVKDLLKAALTFLIPIIVAILSACILLLPTIYTLKTGRTSGKSLITLSRLIPKINIQAFLYSNYSMGLTAISLIALITMLIKDKKHNRLLSILIIAIVSIPLFIYLLNGNLYFRNKVVIPLIPLVILLITKLLDLLLERKISLKFIGLTTILIAVLSILSKYDIILIYLDLALIFLLVYLYYNKKIGENFLLSLLLLAPLITFFAVNLNENYVTKQDLHAQNTKSMTKEIKTTLDKEKDLVRFNNLDDTLKTINYIYDAKYNQDSVYSSVSNQLYKTFYTDTFKNALSYRNNLILAQNNNILFQMFMGVKYIYTTKNPPIGYDKVSENIYQNNNVLPLIYTTNITTSKHEFEELEYPQNIEKLLTSVVVEDAQGIASTNGLNFINEYKPSYSIKKKSNITITKERDYINIKSEDNGKLVLELANLTKDDILILNIPILNKQHCTKGDLKITINGSKNTKTCDEWQYKNNNNVFNYVLSNNDGLKELTINFSKGEYNIGKIESYKLSYNDIKNIKANINEVSIDLSSTTNDRIKGNTSLGEDSYLVTSIPYDDGFTIKIDDKKVEKEIVNTAFLGCKIPKGKHTIEITYKAPLQGEGLILTCLGLTAFMTIVFLEKKKIKHLKK